MGDRDDSIEVPACSVLILTGPPGSGKTTVARKVAGRREPAVHLESDLFWHFITTGYIEPWKPESHAQNTLVLEIVGQVAVRYARAGYFTVIDGIVSPRWFFEPLRTALAATGLRVAYAILRPSLSIAITRATAGQSERLRDRSVIKQLWNDFADLDERLEPHVVDNSNLSADQTVLAIEERLQQGTLTV